jgi:hypothetical protein
MNGEMRRIIAILEGGPGSGFHGHRGRPGEIGGSAPSDYGNSGKLIPPNEITGLLHDKPGNRAIIQIGQHEEGKQPKWFLFELPTPAAVKSLVERVGKMGRAYSAVGRIQSKSGFTLIDTTGMGGR